MLAVNMGEPADQIRSYMLTHKLTFPTLVDLKSQVADRYGVRATPTRFVITREGKAIAGSIGPRDWASEEAQRLIEILLDGSRTPHKE